MANEFKHKTVGTQLTQSEYEAIGGHVLDSQAAGDIIYASSTTQLSRLGIGTAGKLLAVNSGATAPEYVAAVTGVTSVLNTALVVGRDADNDIDFATDNNIIFRAGGADQIKLIDGALLPVTDDDVDLGSSSLQFKDAYFDGTVEADAITVGGTAVLTGGAVTTITSLLATDIKIGEDDETKIDFETADEIHFYANNVEQVYLGDNIFGPQSDSDVDLGSNSVRWKDAYIDTVTTTGDVTVGGDLTITGDDLVMGTNTSGHLLIADGTNFNPTAVGDLSEISTVASDDVLLAVDTSGGGLKKITRSTLVSGLATSSGISNIVEDTSPELGGDLDVLTHGIVTGASNRNIALTPHGTGVVRIDGTNGIDMESGAISIKNSGAESYVRFYCESGNAHYTQLQASPHSAYSGNVTVVLPAAATNLVGDDTTQTLTNKTLTSPKINENVAVTSTATEINILDGVTATTAELNIMDGVTSTTAELNILDGVTSTAAELNILDGVTSTTAELNILDGVTSTTAELNILDGVTATATELNIMDGNTSVGTTTVVDGDGIVTNDGGTMKQTSVETFATYFSSEITSMSNLTSVGTLTTLTVDNIITNGTTIGHTDDTDLLTLADGSLTLAGDLTLGDDKKITLGDEGTVVLSDVSPSTNERGTGLVIKGVLTSNVGGGEVVYLKSDGQYERADKDAESTMPAVGVALEDGDGSNAKNILIYGVYKQTGLSLTRGEELYVSDNGYVTHTVPGSGDFLQRVGVALDTNIVLFMPSLDVIEHA